MSKITSISVVIPSYNRVIELKELLESVLTQTVLPDEVLICEDNSPEKFNIQEMVNSFRESFREKNIEITFIINEKNLGYDKNLRKCIESASGQWALIMGNDDLLLPNAIEDVKSYIGRNSQVNFISRSFIRFNNNIKSPIGLSTLSNKDTIYKIEQSDPKMIFRTAGFVGGLVVNVAFAKSLHTEEFDGSLYYQIYLAASAFIGEGIGYIATPIIGGRADNPPMFGHADDDKAFHVPGSYTARGRATMWSGVLKIAKIVGEKNKVELYDSLKHELMTRQSFHIFEMNAGQSVKVNTELKTELSALGLMNHPMPIFFYIINCTLGKKARYIYRIIRKVMQ
ncbi:glycosyltransferase family 2 protein [Mangrovibacter phragmitis]|uniref:glycosyltransferase family 2 protein n=1 Tax=Mangrovibacter phragmitis TaxID=1691903 RepID=UPI003369BE8B